MIVHREGPWRVTEHDTLEGVYHIDAGPEGYERERIAIVDTGLANAALIAAAPALYEALQEALAWNESDIEGYDDITPTITMLEARRDVLHEALRLAEGGKP